MGGAALSLPRQVALNESPSEKEGKSHAAGDFFAEWIALNESPSEKEGKSDLFIKSVNASREHTLNESPSEKEGKLPVMRQHHQQPYPSMKVPPKRKGNLNARRYGRIFHSPQ